MASPWPSGSGPGGARRSSWFTGSPRTTPAGRAWPRCCPRTTGSSPGISAGVATATSPSAATASPATRTTSWGSSDTTGSTRPCLWVWHRKVKAPTLLLRSPDGLLGETDCLMTQDEAEAVRHAIPRCTLVVVPGTNHYTILLGDNPLVQRALRSFLDSP